MRAAKLVKIAAEAEILRIQHLLKRQGMRVAFGLMAAVFAVGVLVLVNITGWQVLRLYVQPIYATLILLGSQPRVGRDLWRVGCSILAGLCRARSAQGEAAGLAGGTRLTRPHRAGPAGRHSRPREPGKAVSELAMAVRASEIAVAVPNGWPPAPAGLVIMQAGRIREVVVNASAAAHLRTTASL